MNSPDNLPKKRKLSYVPEIPQKKIFRFDNGQPQPSTSKAFWELDVQKRCIKAIHDEYQTSFQNGGPRFSAGESSRMWQKVRVPKLGRYHEHAHGDQDKIISQWEVLIPGEKFDQFDSTEVLEQLNGLMVPGNWSQSGLFERDNRNGYREPPTSPVNRCDGNSKLGGGKTTYDYEEDTDYDSDSDEDCNFKIAWHKYVVQKAQLGLELCENGNYGVQYNHLEKPLQELNDDEEMGDTAVGNSAVLSNEVLEMELELMELFNAMQIQD